MLYRGYSLALEGGRWAVHIGVSVGRRGGAELGVWVYYESVGQCFWALWKRFACANPGVL